MNKDLQKELAFLSEIDRLKGVLRQVLIQDSSRQENTAEHSWHLAMAVLVMHSHVELPINLEKAMKMALLHDLVEIDAGDTFAYDKIGAVDKQARELEAIQRLSSLLPSDLGTEFKNIWLEFEEKKSNESRFVSAMDRALPIIANYQTQGHAWKKHGIKKYQVIERNKEIQNLCPHFWAHLLELLDDAESKGWLARD